jgi:hypothetical protein
MGRRNLRLGGYKSTQAAEARRMSELASKRQAESAAAAKVPAKEKAPADAQVREGPYDRLLRRLREDRAGVEKRGEDHAANSD